MATKTTGIRPKRSKADVQEEFERIKQESADEKIEANPKAAELSKQRETEIKEIVKDVTVEGIVQQVASLGIGVSRSLADLSSRLTSEAALLNSLREAVALERAQLEKLHKMDVAATALDQLIEEYGQKNTALELEIADARAQWDEELEQRHREQKEFTETLNKQRAREKEEYEYQKATERKKEQDQYREALRIEERKNKEKQEALEKSWQMRESSIKEREEEFNRLKKEAAEFPERIKKETEKAVAAAIAASDSRHNQELVILQKEREAERRLADHQIKSLEETVAHQYAQIENIGQRLEEAKKQVQDIAIKAIEGASGARALSHVSQIAMEQAKTHGAQA